MKYKMIKKGMAVSYAEEQSRELENLAIDRFLDNMYFEAIDNLIGDEQINYCELKHFIGATTDCICGKHE